MRVRLRFNKQIVEEPITSKVILEEQIPINILAAHLNQQGGEILAEIEDVHADQAIEAFRKKGVTVNIRKPIEVDIDKCTDCGGCYSLCPANAIKIQEDQVIFDEIRCLGSICGLCIDACPTRAITLTK